MQIVVLPGESRADRSGPTCRNRSGNPGRVRPWIGDETTSIGCRIGHLCRTGADRLGGLDEPRGVAGRHHCVSED